MDRIIGEVLVFMSNSAALVVYLKQHGGTVSLCVQTGLGHCSIVRAADGLYLCKQGWLQGYVIGGGGGIKANLTNSRRSMLRFDRLESVNVEVWPARVSQCWGLTDSSQSMLKFDRLESVSVEVWPTQVGRCWGLTGSSWSMLRFDQLESVNVEVWPTRVGQCWGLINSNSFIKQNISIGHFWWSNSVRVWPTQVRIWPTQSATLGGGCLTPTPPWSHPCLQGTFQEKKILSWTSKNACMRSFQHNVLFFLLMFDNICREFAHPLLNLFATRMNAKFSHLHISCSGPHDVERTCFLAPMDDFSMYRYIFLSLALLQQGLLRVILLRNFSVILAAQLWPQKGLYVDVLAFLMEDPLLM